tara:strand:- start:11829 stop:11942 length:114 start_codon:yes stop_codon:yes gene_type:complete
MRNADYLNAPLANQVKDNVLALGVAVITLADIRAMFS